MKLAHKNILLISPEPWGINHVSKHHYAIELAKRSNSVYFLNPPSAGFNLQRVQNNLSVLNYKPTYKGLAKMPSFISAWLIKKEVEKLEKICNATFDIIWSFDSSSFFNLKLLPAKFKISHIVDLSEDKNIKLLNTAADLCLCSSDYILARQQNYSNNAHNIGHGFAPFKQLNPLVLPKPTANVKVGYVGNLLIKYLDWELIYTLVKSYITIEFYFAGPYNKSNLSREDTLPEPMVKTMGLKNAHFIGSIESSQISSFLTQMDILLLAYKANKFKEQLANPHKLLEYLASGKVAVCSWTEEYKNKSQLLEMVENDSFLFNKFDAVINNISAYNSRHLQETRTKYALKNTYKLKLEEIEKIISQLNK